MKILKSFKWVLIVIVVIIMSVVIMYVFGDTGPISSARSERILRASTSILRDINIGFDIDRCHYEGPTRTVDMRNPSLSCSSSIKYNDADYRKTVSEASKILTSRGWVGSKYNNYKITFYKDDLAISIEPFFSEIGSTNTYFSLLISLKHMTVFKIRE